MKNVKSVRVVVDIKEAERTVNAIEEALKAASELQEAINKFNLAIQSLPMELKTKVCCQDKYL